MIPLLTPIIFRETVPLTIELDRGWCLDIREQCWAPARGVQEEHHRPPAHPLHLRGPGGGQGGHQEEGGGGPHLQVCQEEGQGRGIASRIEL